MGTRTSGRLVAGVALVFTSALAHGEGSFAFGPVERISGQSITILGQTFVLASAKTNSTSFALGTLVFVEGETVRVAPGKVYALKSSTPRTYVPGASRVAVSGVISKYEPKTGYLTINGLSVYVVDATHDANVRLAAGEKITVYGLQPLPGGTLTAAQIWKQDTQSSGIEHLYGIEGTGFDKQAIEGTGLTKYSLEGIGVDKQSIEGTGFAKKSIEGTGASTQAIEGTGFARHSIEGTGVNKQSIEGTGIAK